MSRAEIWLSLAVSLDGFIADEQGGVGWLDPYNGEDLGMEDFTASMDVLVMGRATYDQCLTFGPWYYAGKHVIVLTSRPIGNGPEGVEAWLSGPESLVRHLRNMPGKRVWNMGGSKTIEAFLRHDAIDMFDLALVPVLLGRGIRLFNDDAPAMKLGLVRSQASSCGIVQNTYRRE